MKTKRLKQSFLGWSCLISILLLAFFLYLQHIEAKILSLESKWLIVTGVPVLAALLAGGYIKKFKGFGIELEGLLQNPIGRVSLIATDVLDGLPAQDKGTYRELENLTSEKRSQIRRLSFTTGKKDYYDTDAIIHYLEELPHLKYFEVKKTDGRFVYLIPAKIFKIVQNKYQELKKFIKAIEENSIAEVFGEDAIGESVGENESLLSIVPKIRANKFGVLPVISASGHLIGIVNTRVIESRITDEVIAAHMRA